MGIRTEQSERIAEIHLGNPPSPRGREKRPTGVWSIWPGSESRPSNTDVVKACQRIDGTILYELQDKSIVRTHPELPAKVEELRRQVDTLFKKRPRAADK